MYRNSRNHKHWTLYYQPRTFWHTINITLIKCSCFDVSPPSVYRTCAGLIFNISISTVVNFLSYM